MRKICFISTILFPLALFAGCNNNNAGYYQGQYEYLNDPMYNPPLNPAAIYTPPDIPIPQIYIPPTPKIYVPPPPPAYIPPPAPPSYGY